MKSVKTFSLAVLVCALLGISLSFAHENSTFTPDNSIYRLKYSTHFKVYPQKKSSDYLDLAVRHNSFVVGAIYYNVTAVNSMAMGNSLRRKGDVVVDAVVENSDQSMDLQYSFDGEIALNRAGLTQLALELPVDLNEVNSASASELWNCSFEEYPLTPVILSTYWKPSNPKCTLPHYTVNGTLEPVVAKVTYPDYPRLVKDGSIQISLLAGIMDPDANHDPYSPSAGDEERIEYTRITDHLLKSGFIRTKVVPPYKDKTSYQETFEGTFGKTKIVVSAFFGNSVYENRGGYNEFYEEYLSAAHDSSVVIYSGHSGFLENPDVAEFYADSVPNFDPNLYQIFVMNGCQTVDNIYSFFALKDPKNLDLFVNARETPINVEASTAPIDAMISWARDGVWTNYPDLVKKMDSKKAGMGVVGEEDNPTAPYEVKP